MFNDRQIESPQLREALAGAKYLFDYLDLAGGIYLVDRSEWASDLIKIMKQAGFTIDYKPFGGQPLPRMSGYDLRRK